jgi:signal transduction histidine kinase
MFGYLLVIVVIWHSLVRINPLFYFMLFGLFGQIHAYLPMAVAIPGSVILSFSMVYLQWGESAALRSVEAWLVAGVISGVGIVISLWLNAIIEQSYQRRQLIEDLARTQSELATAERKAGVLAERQRLAREIHDTLAQGFTSIVMHLEAAEQALLDDKPTAQHHLNLARRTARDNLGQARRVVQDLRPEALEEGSLPDAIRRVVSRWGEESGVVAQATITGQPDLLHPEIEVTLLRAVQEALANARKHAHAGRVDVTLSYTDDLIILDVQDDGVGFQNGRNSDPTTGGFGLTGMRERVEQLQGSLLIESASGEGTTLVITIPLGAIEG